MECRSCGSLIDPSSIVYKNFPEDPQPGFEVEVKCTCGQKYEVDGFGLLENHQEAVKEMAEYIGNIKQVNGKDW
jgi:hypothetical protein